MARPTVVQLREFYASPLGKQVRRSLIRVIKQQWGVLGDDTLCGVGYANPLLRPFIRQERSAHSFVLSLMPASQGAIVWPDYGSSRAALYQPRQFPIRDNRVNRLLLVHALEHSEDEAQLIAECWRVLTPGGRMIVIAPNRRSVWSGAGSTPFSYGKPFTLSQLRDAVCQQFTHMHCETALLFPPVGARWLARFNVLLERAGSWLTPMLGGVWVMEVEKQIYAGLKEKKSERGVLRPAYLPVGGKPALPRKCGE